MCKIQLTKIIIFKFKKNKNIFNTSFNKTHFLKKTLIKHLFNNIDADGFTFRVIKSIHSFDIHYHSNTPGNNEQHEGSDKQTS